MVPGPEGVELSPPSLGDGTQEGTESFLGLDPEFSDSSHLETFEVADHGKLSDIVIALDSEPLDKSEDGGELGPDAN